MKSKLISFSGVGASVVSLVFKIKIAKGGDGGWLAGIASMTTYGFLQDPICLLS